MPDLLHRSTVIYAREWWTGREGRATPLTACAKTTSQASVLSHCHHIAAPPPAGLRHTAGSVPGLRPAHGQLQLRRSCRYQPSTGARHAARPRQAAGHIAAALLSAAAVVSTARHALLSPISLSRIGHVQAAMTASPVKPTDVPFASLGISVSATASAFIDARILDTRAAARRCVRQPAHVH